MRLPCCALRRQIQNTICRALQVGHVKTYPSGKNININNISPPSSCSEALSTQGPYQGATPHTDTELDSKLHIVISTFLGPARLPLP